MGIIRIKRFRGGDYCEWANNLRSNGKEYRNFIAFLNELDCLETDVVEADFESERRLAEKQFNEVDGLVKRFISEHLMFAFRSGVNLHCELHIYPEPTMFVWFEDTGQKRVIPKIKSRGMWNLSVEDGVIIPGMCSGDFFDVRVGGYIVSSLSGVDEYLILRGQEYLYFREVSCSSNFKILSKNYDGVGCEKYVFDSKNLAATGFEVPDAAIVKYLEDEKESWCLRCDMKDFISGWVVRWFLPWYIKTFAG